MADGYWKRDSNGDYHWVTYGSGFLAIIIVIVVLGIIMNNVDMGNGSNNNVSNYEYVSNSGDRNSSETNNKANDGTRKKLTDLHVFGTHSEFLDNIENGSVTDSYGKTYKGPYLDLCSYGNNSGEDYETQAYTEFIADGNYSYLSGTFFTRANQSDDHSIEFLIFADDELIYSSGEINRKTKAIDFKVDISGCKIIRVQSRSKNYTSMGTNPGVVLVDGVVYN